LTGLPNRWLLADRFEQALRTDMRASTTTGLLLIDLDRFGEPINTRHSRIFSSRRGSRHRPSSAARNVRRVLSRQTYKIARTAVLKPPHEASC
jgi:predicted signal transduction protein with EAL and GGDEF domain